ncbi:hypothetical protein DH2020_033478 [Rehmannia glutinosa]|uniref:Uncharacterized protein n=1 Tax=Rehmannia glutinosa TaxID=99300 RepID=A0ABR0VF67_REHGL
MGARTLANKVLGGYFWPSLRRDAELMVKRSSAREASPELGGGARVAEDEARSASSRERIWRRKSTGELRLTRLAWQRNVAFGSVTKVIALIDRTSPIKPFSRPWASLDQKLSESIEELHRRGHQGIPQNLESSAWPLLEPFELEHNTLVIKESSNTLGTLFSSFSHLGRIEVEASRARP